MKSQMQAVALIAVFLCLLFSIGLSAVPQLIHFQSRITDNLGNPITVPVDLTLNIYDVDVGGVALLSETFVGVAPDEGGVVSLQLGWADSYQWDVSNQWLGITVNTDPEMTPRIRILSVPYALVSEGLSGDVETDPGGDMLLAGRVGNPPQLIIKDDPSVTPTVDEYLRMTDLKVSLIVDRGAGNVDWSALEADKLTVWHPTGEIGSRLDKRSLQLTSPDITLPIPEIVIPADPEPYFLIADDVFGQMFATMSEAGRLRAITETNGVTIGELLPSELSFSRNNGALLGCRVGFSGLEVHGGSVQLLGGTDLTVTGTLDISGGTLDLSSSSLSVGGDLTVAGSLSVDGGILTTDGAGTLTFDGVGTSSLSLSESGLVSDLGSVRIDDGGGVELLMTEVRATDLTLTSGGLDVVTLSNEVGGSGGGRISVSDGGTGSLVLDGTSLVLSNGTSDAFIRRIGDVVSVEIPPLTTAGLDLGGTVTFTNPKLMTVTSGSEVLFETGSFSDYLGVTGDLRVDGGGLRLRGSGSLVVEPAGGGAGARVSVDLDELVMTDDVPTATALLHRSDGLTLVLASGHTAYYRADGVQLTGPGASEYGATHRGFSLTRPSTNDALVCTIDDAQDVFYCDLDDDGLRDVSCRYTPAKTLVLESGTGFICDGPTSLSSCDVSGPSTFRDSWSCDADDDATVDLRCDVGLSGPRLLVAAGTDFECEGTARFASTCELEGPTVSRDYFEFDPNDDGLADAVCESTPIGQTFRVLSGTEMRCQGPTVCESTLEAQGTMNCRSDWSCDANDDGTIDVQCSALTGPELLVATGTRFACDGLATFAQPTAVNSDLTVTGSLTVFGPKAFAQQHPEDPTKEIIYVALEGNEAGTYTRGSAQLNNGVAEIQLPEDFHLVTNEEGLTAQITPRGPVNSMLYVESVTPTTLVVKASNKKDANAKFDFMVNGVRSGFENHQVIRDKKSLALNE